MPYADLIIYLDDIKERADYAQLLAELRRIFGMDDAATGTFDD
jgi:hypothetical protein